MITHNLIQGTPEWHQFRLEHFGASEAAAMLGLSKKVTRTELLHMKSTGTAREFSDWVQKNILDYGHEVEALARPIIEEEFRIDLYPVTCSDGLLSASCDGLTLCEETAYEHKQWNESLAASVREEILPEEHVPQCMQIMMVTGAKRVIFTVSDGTRENMVWTEVFPDPVWFDRIRAGWQQFAKDLADYVPVIHAEKPEPEAVMQLPALSIQTSGSISIISNLEIFGKKLTEFVDGLDLEPTDDQGFANAEGAVKVLQKAQDALEAAEASALAQASDVDEMRRTVALYADTARKTRLMLERMVKARKEQIKESILTKARVAFAAHLDSLEEEIKPIQLGCQYPDLIAAAKNKRTLASLHDAVETALANAKIAVDARAKDVRAKLAWHKENAKGYEFLFSDLDRVIYKPADDFQMLVQNRIAQHKMDEAKRLEAEQVRIRAEEQKKAEEKVRSEQVAAAQPAPAAIETPKPVLVKSDTKPNPISPAMIGLARHELTHIRKKYAALTELSEVMEVIDSFLSATEKTA
jgi:predicted phage-related endonuclease